MEVPETTNHSELDEEDLDTFIKLTNSYGADEAERRISKWLEPVQVAGLRRAYDDRVRRLVELRDPPGLDREEIEGWYAGPQEDDRFWPALYASLRDEGWVLGNLQSLDRASSKIVARMSHPLAPSFKTKGLVIGHVQSGKTTNFTSVIAKAADVGYRLFIVLSGIHNGLREQTQERMLEALVAKNPSHWLPLTGPGHDFTPPENATVYLSQEGQNYVLCVVKKNASRLRKLRDWLRSADPRVLERCPVLMIDDEADQAGVATTTINGLIRDILDLLPKAAYIGYTATPFANLLIDPSAKDLYPSDFIVDLPQPDEHFGTEVIFGRDAVEGEEEGGPLDGYDMVREVPIEELPHLRPAPRQPVEDFEPEITPSLRHAVLYFWLATAARRVRGAGTPHSTMLIHTSVRVAVHESFRDPLDGLRSETVRRLASEDPELLNELRAIWLDETGRVQSDEFGEEATSFDELAPYLREVVGETVVVLDNSRSPQRLAYRDDEPVVAIAVGGNTLSRGLTLEGLVVSFFVRSASAYDTLLQMGRWFGYRHGYADLPRIWMTEELRRWFRHLATVETEIRRDIQRYEEENLTPEEFAVRIRTHPALTITAASKMRDAVTAYASYGGRRVQTRYFCGDDAEWLARNISVARDLIDDAVSVDHADVEHRDDGAILLKGVSSASVLRFLRSYAFHDRAFDLDPDIVSRYVERQNEKGRLGSWNVALMTGAGGAPEGPFNFGHGLEVTKLRRSKLRDANGEFDDIKTLMSKEDRVVDLPHIGQTEARRMTEKALADARATTDPALLALYPIDRDSPPDPANEKTRVPLGALDDVIGVGLVFPGTGGEDAVAYLSADLSRLGLTVDDVESSENEDPDADEAEAA